MKREEVAVIVIAALLIAGSFIASLTAGREDAMDCPERMAIELPSACDTTGGLVIGYNYFLLDRYAKDHGLDCGIVISRRGEHYLDSLRAGAVDLVAIPCSSEIPDSVEVSIPIDGISLWAVRKEDGKILRDLNSWLQTFFDSEEHLSRRESFLNCYNPVSKAASGKKSRVLSPYDDIVRAYADSIGWDWKLITAVMFQESRFRIEARSCRGALGLMQMMPATARKWCNGNPVDPENSIRSGSLYLKEISKIYMQVSDDPLERQKYTLAAYNAGICRVQDIINLARERNICTSQWDSVITVIPEMRDTLAVSASDTVKLGVFQGRETMAFVDRVMCLYEAFDKIYIEQ